MRYKAPGSANQRGNLKYLEELRTLSRSNRKNPTESEKTFWKLLSYKKLHLKFLRQKPMGKFIWFFIVLN
jgi:very-short-patch-repair endonuclease